MRKVLNLCKLANENNLHISLLITFYVISLSYRNSNTNLKFTIMRHTSQENLVKSKIEALVINNNVKEAINYAISKGVTAEEFGKIAGKYWKL